MKKVIALTLTVLILLTMASCGKKAEETPPATTVPETTQAPVPTETTEPTIPAPTEPEWEPGIVRAGYGEAVYRTFAAGTQLKVIGKFMNYYVVEQEDVDLLVHRDMLRMESEEAFESWNGYSKSGTEVFDNPYFRGEAIATLNKNTQVTILESNGGWAYIEWDGGKGYVKADMLSKWRISGGSPSSDNGGSGNSGNGGGGNNDGTDVPIGSLTSVEESFQPQIVLLGAYYGPEMEKDFTGGMATVLADKTEGYICLLVRGDEVKVTAFDENTATIWLGEEQYAEIPRFLVKLESDAAYESWTGYSRWNGMIYEEYQMDTEKVKLSTNKQVTVLDEVNGCYVVEYEGQIGYMETAKVSEKRIVSTPSNDDGGSGGGTGGGSGSTWTPPKL